MTDYMHVNTGSVDTYENWECDCESTDKSVDECIADGSLVEVVQNESGDWVEVE